MFDAVTDEVASTFAVYHNDEEGGIVAALDQVDGIAYRLNSMDGSETWRCVQVMDEDGTKEKGLKRVAEMLGVDLETAMGIGDGPGDADFLNIVGTPVVMGNADLPMLTLPRRLLVPSVGNDGFAVGVERHVFGEQGEPAVNTHPKWRTGVRVAMSETVRDSTLAMLAQQRPLVDVERFSAVFESYTKGRPLDPWHVTRDFIECFGERQELFTSDIGLLRACRLDEHNSAVAGLFEQHFAPYLYHDPDTLMLVRMTLQLQDVGKSLGVAVAGDSFAQKKFNAYVVENVLSGLEDERWTKFRQAIPLLLDQDIIGSLLRANESNLEQKRQEAHEAVAAIRQDWPEGFSLPLDDLLVMLYVCDAGAHTRYAQQVSGFSEELEWAVVPEDAQLTHLFEQEWGERLTLQPEVARRIHALLPGVEFLQDYLGGEQDPLENLSAEFRDVIRNLFLRQPQAVQRDNDGLERMQVKPTDLEQPPASLEWAQKVTVFSQGKNEIPPMPPRVMRPYIVVGGRAGDYYKTATFYTRGGKIWRIDDEQNVARPVLDKLWLNTQTYEIEETGRQYGERARSRVRSSVDYGRPLTDQEAEDLNIWFGLCEDPWEDGLH